MMLSQTMKNKSGVVIKCLNEAKVTSAGIQRVYVTDATKLPRVKTLCFRC